MAKMPHTTILFTVSKLSKGDLLRHIQCLLTTTMTGETNGRLACGVCQEPFLLLEMFLVEL